MKRLIATVLFAALPVAAQNDPPRAEIQVACGTLAGQGHVRLVVGEVVVLGPFLLSCGERT